ncbi:hypothetical protein DFP73DRAFT_563727 [Morchella snyderi]|nr:hypothetical protein DFP73DRAFT_563727 [Morchella snyderi]
MSVCVSVSVSVLSVSVSVSASPPSDKRLQQPKQTSPHHTHGPHRHPTTTSATTSSSSTEYTQNTPDSPQVACTSHLPHGQAPAAALCAYSPCPLTVDQVFLQQPRLGLLVAAAVLLSLPLPAIHSSCVDSLSNRQPD